jgi:hypothetical protein
LRLLPFVAVNLVAVNLGEVAPSMAVDHDMLDRGLALTGAARAGRSRVASSCRRHRPVVAAVCRLAGSAGQGWGRGRGWSPATSTWTADNVDVNVDPGEGRGALVLGANEGGAGGDQDVAQDGPATDDGQGDRTMLGKLAY